MPHSCSSDAGSIRTLFILFHFRFLSVCSNRLLCLLPTANPPPTSPDSTSFSNYRIPSKSLRSTLRLL